MDAIEVAGRDLRDRRRELMRGLVAEDVADGERQPGGLGRDRVGDLGPPVADVRDRDPGDRIEVAVAAVSQTCTPSARSRTGYARSGSSAKKCAGDAVGGAPAVTLS